MEFTNPTKRWLISLIWAALLFSGAPVNADPYSTDTDGDGYSDGEELAGGYDPNNSAVYPGYEASIDSDGDGYSDYDENNQGSNPSDPSSYPGSAPDPASQDTDGDGYSDTDEAAAGTDPYSSTSYPGSYVDPYTIDSDGDGFTDGVESSSGTNPYDSANYPTYGPEYSPDTDGDTYSDADEVSNGTDPNNAASYPGSTYYSDSDWDGWSDGDEIAAGTDPNNSGSYPGAPDPYTTDSDGDGYYDYDENSQGTDPYSSTSYPGYLNSIDSDGDGHYDADEIAMGYNPNDPASFPGMQNSTSDSDGDGHSDYDENMAGTNPYDSSSYPGSYSYYDSDGDGYYDNDEYMAGTNPYDSSSYPGSTSNYADSDGDGLYDSEEQSLGTNPNLADSDDDGLSDYSEVRGIEVTLWIGDSTSGYGMSHTYTTNPNNPDTDGDLLPDGWEIFNGTVPDNAADGLSDGDNDGLSLGRELTTHFTDPTKRDTDEDGESDGYEVAQGTNPLVQSSRTSVDTDGDVMSDQWETQYGLDPTSATDASGDGDDDGLINLREYFLGTSPANSDSDGDGYKDGFEWNHGFNPLNSGDASQDSDGDSMSDLWELFYGLDPSSSNDRYSDSDGDWVQAEFEFYGGLSPNNADTDGDGISDYDEYYGIIQPPLDSDGDQINDSDEIAMYETDPYDSDSDDDGISDYGEIFGSVIQVSFNGQNMGVGFVTDPNLRDTDQDGMDDLYEILHFFDPTDPADGSQDEDGDTIFNGIETSVYLTDPFKSDTDADGESDSLELAQGTDPLNPQSNLLDSDGDQMRDSWELANQLNPSDPSDATGNPDDDGLVNVEEFQNNTNPHARDSDGDGYEDRFELIHGFSPSDASDATNDSDEDDMPDLWELSHQLNPSDPGDAEDDFDNDMLWNVDEFLHGTRPDRLDSDLDGLDDFVEVHTPRLASPGEAPTFSYTDPLDPDSDGDLLSDGFEVTENLEPLLPSDGAADRDGDGLSNGAEVSIHQTDWKLRDTDSDGEWDGFEIENETNPLDILSRTSVDSDGDHMSDEWELAKGLDHQVANGGEDPDNDSLNNHGEYLAGTDPNDRDSDDDNYLDGFERLHRKDPLNPADAEDDTDKDLLPDLWEMFHNLPWQNPTHEDNDPDDDEVENLTEFQNGSNPHLTDTDGDGIGDYSEIAGQGTTPGGIVWAYDIHPGKSDTDGDTQNDLYEIENGKDPTDPLSKVVAGADQVIPGGNILSPVDGSSAPTSPFWTFGVVDDSDGDGISDAQEQVDGTDPDDGTDFKSQLNVGLDADRDGLPDAWEQANGLDPTDSTQGWRDFDYDRLNNLREHAFNTSPVASWSSVGLNGMLPEGPRLGQDPRFPTSTLPTFNDFNEMAKVSLVSGEVIVSIFNGQNWGPSETVALPFIPTSIGEAVQNNFGLLAFEVRRATDSGEITIIVVRDRTHQIQLIGSDAGWSDISGIRLTDSGFLAAQVAGPLPNADESLIRWRKGTLLHLPHNGSVQLRGLNERGELLDGSLGLYRNGTWDASFAGSRVMGPYGEVANAPTYPKGGAILPYSRFSSLSTHGEIVSGVSRIDLNEVVRGYHARYSNARDEFLITLDDWLAIHEVPYIVDPEIPSGGIWSEGYGGSFSYYFEGPGTPIYDFDFDFDDDGFWNDLETTALTDPNSSSEHPGAGENIVVSDANQAGDFVGWVYRGTTEHDAVSGLSIPSNEAYLWQYRDFRFLGGADHAWVLNNLGAFIGSDLVPLESASGGGYSVGHQFRLFRPENDANGNGLADNWETFHAITSVNADLDGDGLTARQEFAFGTSPNHTDTDGDGLRDRWELENGTDPKRRDIGLGGDLDGDTLDWLAESHAGTDPYLSDTDGDGVRDDWESKHGRNPLDSADSLTGSGDFDNDGYTNAEEWSAGTNPFDPQSNTATIDTDGDKMPDLWEVSQGFNPLDSADAVLDLDNDGLTNAQEFENGSSPRADWKWIPIEPLNYEASEVSHHGYVPHFVGSLNDLGQIASAVRNGDSWTLHIWDGGHWSAGVPLGSAPGFTRVEAVRLNNLGLAAIQLRNPTTQRVRVVVHSPGNSPIWLGVEQPWQVVRDLEVTDSGFVGGNAILAGSPVGRASFVWRKGQFKETALPAGEEHRRGLSERGEKLSTESMILRGETHYQNGGYPLAIGAYGNLWFNPRPSEPFTMQYAKQLGRTSAIAPSGHRFLSEQIQLNGPWHGSLAITGSNGTPIGFELPPLLPYVGGAPLESGIYATDMNRAGEVVGVQIAEHFPESLYAAFLISRDGGIQSFAPTHDSLGGAFAYSASRFHEINGRSQVLAWAKHSEDVFDEINQTNVNTTTEFWGLRTRSNDLNGNGMADDWETFHGVSDPAADPDGDGLANRIEYALGLDPNEKRSDSDVIDDGWEVFEGVDPLVAESQSVDDVDGDGLTWATEFKAGLDPYLDDSDGNGVGDATEDSDTDGLSNLAEQNIGSNPGAKDSNGNGYDDLEEITNGSNPIGSQKKKNTDTNEQLRLRGDLKIRRVEIANQKWGRRRLDSNFAINGGVDDDYYLTRVVEFSCFESETREKPFTTHIGNGGVKSTFEWNSSEVLDFSGKHTLRYEPEWKKGPGGWNLHSKLFVSANFNGSYEFSNHSESTRQCYSGSESESTTELDESSTSNVNETIAEKEIQHGRREEYFVFPAPLEWERTHKRKGCALGAELETTFTSGTAEYYNASVGPTSGFMTPKVHMGNMPANASGGEVSEDGTIREENIQEENSFTHLDGTDYETELRRSVKVTLKDKYTEQMAISDGWDGLSQAESSLGEDEFFPANRSLIAHRRVDPETGKFHCSSCDYVIEWSGGIPGGTVVWFEVFQPLDYEKPYEVERFTATLDSAGSLTTEERRISASDFREDGDFFVSRPTSARGGIISPNTGDDDGDGIPNFADGFSDLFADQGLNVDEHPELRNSVKEFGRLIPLGSYSDNPNVPNSEETVSFNTFGKESNPSSMAMENEPSGEFGRVELPTGSIRIWALGSNTSKRKAASILAGGDYIPSGAEIPISKLDGKAIFLEVLRPSAAKDDLKVEVLSYRGVDNFAFTSVSTDFHALLEGGGTERLPAMSSSLPSPEITISNFQVTSTRPSPDGDGLLANITVSGSLASAVCDITPGGAGRIEEIHAAVNSEPSPDRTIVLNVNKTDNPNDLRRPHPFSATFTRTFPDVPVIEGNNTFSLLATDPVYRLPGSASVAFTIAATPPVGIITERSLTLEFPKPGNGLVAGTVRVTHVRDGIRVIDAAVLSSVTPTRFEQSGTGIALQLGSVPQLDPSQAESFSATITDTGAGWPAEHFPLVGEFTADGSIFGATNGGVETVSYAGWDVEVEGIGAPDSQGAGEFNPMVVKLTGPADLLDTLERVQIGDTKVPVIKKNGSYYLAREDDANQVATVIATPIRPDVSDELGQLGSSTPDWDNLPDDVPEAELDAALKLLERKDPDWRNLAKRIERGSLLFGSASLTDKADLKYYKGLFDGFKGNPSDTGSELWGLAKGAVKLASKAVEYSPGLLVFKVTWEFTGGDRFEGEIKAASHFGEKVANGAQTALSYWPQVREFLYELKDKTDAEIAEFLATGRFPGSEKIGPAMELALFTVLNLYVSAMDWWNGLEPYKRGYYQGYILFEVVAAVVSGLLTAPAGGSGAAVVLARHAPKFATVLRKISSGLTRISAKSGDDLSMILTNLGQMIGRALGTSMCFVAGTQVLTAHGSVPIEQIRPGMQVWARDEATKADGWKPVIQTFITHPEELFTVGYDLDGDGTADDEVTGTGEHPFWVEAFAKFLPMRELLPGMRLSLAEPGETAVVVGNVSKRGPPGERFTTYNFEVADYHTYFVGEGRVWVHNTGRHDCEKIAAIYKYMRDNRLGNGIQETPYETFIHMLETLKASSNPAHNNLADAAFDFTRGKLNGRASRFALKAINDEMFELAAAGQLSWRQLPTITELKGPFKGLGSWGNPRPGDMHKHHLLEGRYFSRIKQYLTPNSGVSTADDLPAFVVEQTRHTGKGGIAPELTRSHLINA